MSKEQYKQFEQKREAFFKETQELRAGLFEKERELQNELAKGEPDASKASGCREKFLSFRPNLIRSASIIWSK